MYVKKTALFLKKSIWKDKAEVRASTDTILAKAHNSSQAYVITSIVK